MVLTDEETTNTFNLTTRDGAALKNLRRIYVPNHDEVLCWDVSDLVVAGTCVTHRTGRDLKFLSEQLFMTEIFASELEATRHLVEVADAALNEKRLAVIYAASENEILHAKLSRLEQSNALLLKPSSKKPVESLAGIRY